MSYLVLTRNVGEKILVGNDIEVELVSLTGRQAKIGIRAPKSFKVDREERRQPSGKRTGE